MALTPDLKNIVDFTKGNGLVTAIAQDTDTGEIYSMASVRLDSDTGTYGVTSGNFAAVDAYEPGSVAKVITVASALSEGLVTPETSYLVPWRKQYYDDLLKDSHQHPDEWMSVSRILAESSRPPRWRPSRSLPK